MNYKETGGPAFPQNTKIMLPAGQEVHQGFMGGMTLRDYFAAQAMQAFCISRGIVLYAQAAEEAYRMADAMLEERSK